MPRKYINKGVYCQKYSKDCLLAAVDAVKHGNTNLYAASKQFNVPRNTIRNHVEKKKEPVVHGFNRLVFKNTQENKLILRVKYLCNRGFPLTMKGLRELAWKYASTLNRRKQLNTKMPKGWDKMGMASLDWASCFKKRHPDITLRKPEGLSASRAQAFNEDRVSTFFNDLLALFEKEGLGQFPQLLYNIDETGLMTVPNNASRVLAPKGMRTVSVVQSGERGTLTTVIPPINAIGDYMPPFIIMKGKVPEPARQNLEAAGMSVCSTKSGYIDSDVFLVFLQHFEARRVHIPGNKCVLFFDGHSSHLTVAALDFCEANGIELVCLPPHCSHRLQPLDTHVNKPLKCLWSKAIGDYLKANDRIVISKEEFGALFPPVFLELSGRRGLAVEGFAHCGLYPIKNTVKKEEYSISKSFSFSEPDDASTPNEAGPSNQTQPAVPSPTESSKPTQSPTLQRLAKTPQKVANPYHKKRHEPALKVRLFAKKQKLTDASKAAAALSMTSVKPATFPSTTSKAPVVSGKAPAKLQPKPPKKTVMCSVCDAAFDDAIDDWLKCPGCSNWVCETCFGSAQCFNCE
jgi:hypothetical protein